MQCKCGCGLLPLPRFMNFLDAVRHEAQSPLFVTSGARCAKYNKKFTGKSSGPHVFQIAADLWVYHAKAHLVLGIALNHGATGIGIQQEQGLELVKRFIHLDLVEPGTAGYIRPTVWSY